MDADDDNWARLSDLGNHLNRTDPSFDPRTYGFGKLSDLIKAQAYIETKTVTGASGRGQLWVRLKGRRPVDAASTRKAVKRTTKSAAASSAAKTTKKTTRKAAPTVQDA